ncbi:MAG: phosphoribosylglycinamide formyltransferase [Candidatus Marinimicrobia bacterium]|nr:phosphoribosylglycinamide formyltransferase [Candidatus Neomarinimicrobiota bacterium]
MKNIAVFASGTGSNFINIYNGLKNNSINGEIKLLISNNSNCGAVLFAIKNNIEYKIINDFRFPIEKNKEYELVLNFYRIDLILLAGFMKKIPENIVRLYKNKILNIHPSLLPKYGGQGFYGMKVHEAVIDSKDKLSGATVHFVNEHYDKGAIVLQKSLNVLKSDTPESLSKRILKIEHSIYLEAVNLFCLDKIKIQY